MSGKINIEEMKKQCLPMFKLLRHLVNTIPNDADLGADIRNMIKISEEKEITKEELEE